MTAGSSTERAASADAVTARTLAGALTETARVSPDRAALVLQIRGQWHKHRTVSYAELDRRSDALAAGLSAYGIGVGVRTALMVPVGVDFFLLAFALLKARATPI